MQGRKRPLRGTVLVDACKRPNKGRRVAESTRDRDGSYALPGFVPCSEEGRSALHATAPYVSSGRFPDHCEQLDDADLDAAVDGAMAAKMRNMGEACTAANRFLVQESVAQEFTRKFAKAMGALTTGRGTDPTTQVGPLIDGGARDDVHALVRAAVDAGATAITGGAPVGGPGYFYQPTVLGGVPNDAAILGQEIFGPVAPVTTFSTEEDAIRLANASEYGLASYLYSRDFNKLLRVAEQIEFGMVGFNAGVISNAAAPFGGVKQSGLGREGGTEGIAEYTTTQYIGIADPYRD